MSKIQETVNKLMKMEKLTAKQGLVVKRLLEKASDEYYNTENKIMTDEQYDYIRDLYENNIGLLPIGAMPTEGKGTVNVAHTFVNMVGSLSKVNTIPEFDEWLEKTMDAVNGLTKQVQILASLKYDGNSVAIEYKDGKCIKALTRGRNGLGVDLTHIFKDKTIKDKRYCCVKYEVVVTYDDFEKLLEDTGLDYKNPRSVTAGILGRDDAEKFKQYLTIIPLGVAIDGETLSKKEELVFIKENCESKINYLSAAKIFKGSKDDIVKQVEQLYNLIIEGRSKLNVMIDGIVLEIINPEYKKLGYVNTKPKWSVALKFPYMEKVSKVTGFDFTLGKSQRITPRVWFEPVQFNGATQTKVSLANYKRFMDLGLGIGSDILVEYRNDCLSYVQKLDTDENKNIKPYEFTKECPVCGGKVEVNKNATYAFCSNPNCSGRVVGRVERFLTKLDIKGIKGATLDKLYENDLIENIYSLYNLDYDVVANIEGLGKKSAQIMKKAIESKHPFDYEILGGFGIEDMGNTMSKLLCSNYTLSEILNRYNEKSFYNEVMEIEGFNTITIDKLISGLELYEEEMKNVLKVTKAKNYKDSLAKPVGETYTFCVTGSISKWANRDALKNELELMGHKVSGSVSKKTSYLINNDTESTSGKNKKAKELGIQIINEDQLVELLGL